MLDALVEQVSSADSANFDHYKVYYSILDSNKYGETPETTKKGSYSTLLDVIVLTNNKVYTRCYLLETIHMPKCILRM